ncbi:unnamed protein product [Caenorhabditis nigoni]
MKISFETPQWLTNIYHIITLISILINSLGIYLIRFQSGKIDNFKYFLLWFITCNLLGDFIMFFMTQPIPLLPIWAGHIHGPFWSVFHIGTHMASVIGSVIMGQQAAALTMCFVRKYQAISKLDSQNEIHNNWIVFAACLTQILIGTWIVLYYFSGIDRQTALDFIILNYPEYYSQFLSLDDFQLYLKNGITNWFIFAAAFMAVTFTSIIILCTLITSPVAFLPPVASGFLLAFDFEHIQFISWILLAMTSCHGTINCLVMILTCPPYRIFVKNKILKTFCVKN